MNETKFHDCLKHQLRQFTTQKYCANSNLQLTLKPWEYQLTEMIPGTKVHRNTYINFFCEVESALKSHMLFGNCYGDACITKTHVYNKLIYLQWC